MSRVETTDGIYCHVPKPRSLSDWRDPIIRGALVQKNLQFRNDAIEWANWAGESGKRLIRVLCSRDMLFYFNTWCWTYDPRKVDTPALPFVTWPFQDDALVELESLIGVEDGLIEKSRDMGASWCTLDIFEWRWHFRPLQSFLMASRKEDLVDKADNPDALFWKVDFIHRYQPKWLLPRITRAKLHIGNETNGSTIDGESTTGDLGRAGRRTAILLDEFAAVDRTDGYRVLNATQSVTNSRLFNSTPQGRANAYADLAHMPGMQKIRFHWSLHPEKSLGLYTSEKNKSSGQWSVKILDTTFKFDDDFKFVLDGKLRSPWYDRECRRTPIPTLIAQELDIDYLGSGAMFFDASLVDELIEETVREPYSVGELDYDTESLEPKCFMERKRGRIKLWVHVDADGGIPLDRTYVVGCDVSEGTGASSSTMSIADRKTGEKVGEISDNTMRPEQWGSFAVAVCRFFNNAMLIWEANGAGRGFGSAVLDLKYTNIYFRQNEQSVSRRRSDIPGWFSTKENKKLLLSEYHTALARRQFINRSKGALRECLEYVHSGNGVEHTGAMMASDPSASGDNHGDMVIGDALAWRGLKTNPESKSKSTTAVAPEGSFAWRRRLAQAKQAESESDTWG